MTLDPIISKEFDEKFGGITAHEAGQNWLPMYEKIKSFLAQKIEQTKDSAYTSGFKDGSALVQRKISEAVQKREEEILANIKSIGELPVVWTEHAVKSISKENLALQTASNKGWNLCYNLVLSLITSHPPQESAEEVEWIACKKCGDEVKVPLGRTHCYQCRPDDRCCDKCYCGGEGHGESAHSRFWLRCCSKLRKDCPCHQEKK